MAMGRHKPQQGDLMMSWVEEIATWLGQQSSQMARHYSARADKKRRMEATITKIEKVNQDRAKPEQNLSGKPK